MSPCLSPETYGSHLNRVRNRSVLFFELFLECLCNEQRRTARELSLLIGSYKERKNVIGSSE